MTPKQKANAVAVDLVRWGNRRTGGTTGWIITGKGQKKLNESKS